VLKCVFFSFHTAFRMCRSPSPSASARRRAMADLKIERGSVQGRATIAESEAMPLRYAAELIGVGANSERAIRWLIALMVLTCDPLAIALTAAVSARRSADADEQTPRPCVSNQREHMILHRACGKVTYPNANAWATE
jgi:hypothetical protein